MHSLDLDLLEEVEIYKLFDQEVVTEASIAGMKITKESLQDENFVKELIKKIDIKEEKTRDVSNAILAIGIISLLTIIGIPIGILLFKLSSIVSKNGSSDKNLRKTIDCIDKTIDKLNKKNQKKRTKIKRKNMILLSRNYKTIEIL